MTDHLAPLLAELEAALAEHIGAAQGISAEALAAHLDIPPRRLRALVSIARELGTAICGHPATGYYIAATAAELEETCRFLRARAMHSLRIEAQLRRIPLPDLLGQLHIPT